MRCDITTAPPFLSSSSPLASLRLSHAFADYRHVKQRDRSWSLSYVLPLHCTHNVHARRFSSEKEADQLSDSSVNAVTPSPRQSPAKTIADKAANHSLYVVVHNTSTHWSYNAYPENCLLSYLTATIASLVKNSTPSNRFARLHGSSKHYRTFEGFRRPNDSINWSIFATTFMNCRTSPTLTAGYAVSPSSLPVVLFNNSRHSAQAETTQWWPASTGTLGNRRIEGAPRAQAVGCGDDLTGCNGEKPRELNWSSLAGTCTLIYYYIGLYMFVPDLPMTVLEYSGI